MLSVDAIMCILNCKNGIFKAWIFKAWICLRNVSFIVLMNCFILNYSKLSFYIVVVSEAFFLLVFFKMKFLKNAIKAFLVYLCYVMFSHCNSSVILMEDG
jgi:hypothetical protein